MFPNFPHKFWDEIPVAIASRLVELFYIARCFRLLTLDMLVLVGVLQAWKKVQLAYSHLEHRPLCSVM
jgi:hypothetical protein